MKFKILLELFLKWIIKSPKLEKNPNYHEYYIKNSL